MCYSLEVQFITAALILISCLVYFLFFARRYAVGSWQRKFIDNVLLGFSCIGLHQFFEFLSLLTNNSIVYKTGLLFSLATMFFVLRSAEVLFNKKLHSKIALFVVGIIGVQLLLVPVEFSAKGFYVEHQSTFFWAAAWMLLFIYWNVAVLKNLRTVNEQSRKVAIYYLFAVLNTSFILSAIYTLYGYAYLSVNVCHDSPSIWCTFFVIQAIILPFFLASFDRSFRRPEKQGFGNKEFLILLCVSLFIIVMLVFTLPFFDCLSWKFIFP